MRELWLSAMGWAKFVVRAWPPESTRTRSRGSLPGLTPARGGFPVLAETFVSLSVLPVTVGWSGAAVAPGFGVLAAAPSSPGLFLLNGKAAARACVPCALRTAGFPLDGRGPFRDPLTVDLAASGPPGELLRGLRMTLYLRWWG